MTEITYEIHAWRKDGPAYVKRTYRAGFANRRNRWSEEEVGSRGGRSVEAPDYYLLDADGDVETWAFNRGHSYLLDVVVDGLHKIETVVDATGGYQTLVTPESVSIEEIRPLDPSTPTAAEEAVSETAPESEAPLDIGDDEDDVDEPQDHSSEEE